jgi:hypothetical protein
VIASLILVCRKEGTPYEGIGIIYYPTASLHQEAEPWHEDVHPATSRRLGKRLVGNNI